MDRASNLLRRIVVFGALAIAFLAVLALRPSRTTSLPGEGKLSPTFAPIDVAKVQSTEPTTKTLIAVMNSFLRP